MSKKLCKDTEIKAFSHWHFKFSMARFWAVPVFSNKVWTIWSAYATADYPAGQTYQHKSPLDNGEIFLYSHSWLVGLRNRCWIKGLGKNPQNEWARLIVVCSACCPASPKRDSLDSEKMACLPKLMPQNVFTRPLFYSWEKFCVYTRQPTRSG